MPSRDLSKPLGAAASFVGACAGASADNSRTLDAVSMVVQRFIMMTSRKKQDFVRFTRTLFQRLVQDCNAANPLSKCKSRRKVCRGSATIGLISPLQPGSAHRVVEQHGNRHRSDTTGNGRNRRGE